MNDGGCAEERYLGRKLALESFHAVEMQNRIAAGWASFIENKLALCNSQCNLNHRLRAFDAIVTPTVLYDS